VRYQSLTNRPL